jgi:hypothetical protein
MLKIKEKVLTRFMIKENFFAFAGKFTVLLGLAVAAPFLHFQAVTGTIVNAVLIIAVVILGRKEAITIGIFPSLMAIVMGLLSKEAVPLIPFIILGNIILIFAFDILRKENYWKGVVLGGTLKFTFLIISGIVLVGIFENTILAKVVFTMLGWQQLLTALSGGVVAYAVLRVLKKHSSTNFSL